MPGTAEPARQGVSMVLDNAADVPVRSTGDLRPIGVGEDLVAMADGGDGDIAAPVIVHG